MWAEESSMISEIADASRLVLIFFTELKRERRLIQKDLEALNLMNERTCTDKPKPDVSQIPSRSDSK